MLALLRKPRKVESPESLLPCPGGLNLACFCPFFSSGVFPEKTASGDLSRILVENGEKKCLSPLLGCFVEGSFAFWARKNGQQQSGVVNFRHWKQSGLGSKSKNQDA